MPVSKNHKKGVPHSVWKKRQNKDRYSPVGKGPSFLSRNTSLTKKTKVNPPTLGRRAGKPEGLWGRIKKLWRRKT